MRAWMRLIAAGACCCVAVTGCKASDQLSSRDVVVHLKDGTTEAQNTALVERCGAVPHTSAAPLNPRLAKLSIRFREAHFVVTPATDGNLNKLYTCLQSPDFAGYLVGVDIGGM